MDAPTRTRATTASAAASGRGSIPTTSRAGGWSARRSRPRGPPPLRAASLVVARTSTPRDSRRARGTRRHVRRDRSPPTTPRSPRREEHARAEAARGGAAAARPVSMRFATLSQVLLAAAALAERHPAGARARRLRNLAAARRDAPGQVRRARDLGCLHHCLRGVPEVFNGELLACSAAAATPTARRRCSRGGAARGTAAAPLSTASRPTPSRSACHPARRRRGWRASHDLRVLRRDRITSRSLRDERGRPRNRRRRGALRSGATESLRSQRGALGTGTSGPGRREGRRAPRIAWKRRNHASPAASQPSSAPAATAIAPTVEASALIRVEGGRCSRVCRRRERRRRADFARRSARARSRAAFFTARLRRRSPLERRRRAPSRPRGLLLRRRRAPRERVRLPRSAAAASAARAWRRRRRRSVCVGARAMSPPCTTRAAVHGGRDERARWRSAL